MEKHMVQCEDGRRRQARIQGMPREEGDFKIWKAGVRLKGKHVSGEAWYSFKTKTWHFLTDPEGKHSHLMQRLQAQQRQEAIRKLKARLRVLESRLGIEQKKIAKHRAAEEAIASEVQALDARIGELESGAPLESGTSLEYSRHIKRQ